MKRSSNIKAYAVGPLFAHQISTDQITDTQMSNVQVYLDYLYKLHDISADISANTISANEISASEINAQDRITTPSLVVNEIASKDPAKRPILHFANIPVSDDLDSIVIYRDISGVGELSADGNYVKKSYTIVTNILVLDSVIFDIQEYSNEISVKLSDEISGLADSLNGRIDEISDDLKDCVTEFKQDISDLREDIDDLSDDLSAYVLKQNVIDAISGISVLSTDLISTNNVTDVKNRLNALTHMLSNLYLKLR